MTRGWIGLAILLITLLGGAASGLDAEESDFLGIINAYRASYGLGSLSLSPTLTVAAELHSQDMADNNYFSHYSQDGRSPLDRVIDAGYNYPTAIGENIAAGYVTAADVFEGWRNSPGHNQTMLYPSFVVIGIGRVYNASSYYDWYWTTDFGGYDDSGGPPPPPPPTAPITSPTHPSQNTWYPDPSPLLDWDDISGAEGYSYVLDHSSVTTPDTVIDTTISSKSYSDLSDGTWYFHLRVKTSGGWGQATHYRIRVDCTAPSSPAASSSTHPDPETGYADDSPQFSWSAPSDTSGISGYSYILDHLADTVPDAEVDTASTSRNYSGLADGQWFFHVRAVDNAGNPGQTSHVQVNIRYAPDASFEASPTTGFEPLFVQFQDTSASSSGITEWLWDFGDGFTSTLQNPSHFYEEEGDYTVTLTIREADLDSDTIVVPQCIQVAEPEPPPGLLEGLWANERVIGADLHVAYVNADSYVDPAEPWMNHGHGEWLLVDSGGRGACLGIDLGGIPGGSTVTSALLGVYVDSSLDLDPAFLSAYRATGDWVETTVAWATRPLPVGGPCDTVDLPPGTEGYLILDIGDAVQEALEGGYLTVYLAISSGSGNLSMSAREGSFRPVVLIEHAEGEVHAISLSSAEGTGLAPNLGEISVDGSSFGLPHSISAVSGSYQITYLPGYLFASWQSSGGVSTANHLDPTTTLVVQGNGEVVAIGDLLEIRYAHDDGSAEYSTGRSPGEMVGVAFSPLLVGRLSSIQIYISRIYPSTNNTCLLRVMDSAGGDLGGPLPFCPADSGWLTVDVPAGPRIAGNFIIAVEYLNDDHPRVGVDSSGAGQSMTYWDGEWSHYHSNYMIRCNLEVEQPPRRIALLSSQAESHALGAGLPIELSFSLDPPIEGALVQASMLDPEGLEHDVSGTTNSTGCYTTSILPLLSGDWELTARWGGNDEYEGAEDRKTLRVERGYPLIDCGVQPFFSDYGDQVVIQGTVSPVTLDLVLQFRFGEGEWLPLAELMPLDNLTYIYTWVPPDVGEYEFRAVWEGDQNFEASASYPASHQVMRGASNITMEVDRTTVRYGESITISGVVNPCKATTVEIQLWQGMDWETLCTVGSDEDGAYSFDWGVEMVGTALLQASWPGDDRYRAASSSALIILCEKAPAGISLRVEPAEANPNQSVRAHGTLVPSLKMEILITIIEPGGQRTHMQSTSNSSGGFSVEFDPDELGEWRVIATWTGNNHYEGCSSPEVKVWVDIPECLLACTLPLLVGALLRRASS